MFGEGVQFRANKYASADAARPLRLTHAADCAGAAGLPLLRYFTVTNRALHFAAVFFLGRGRENNYYLMS